MTHKIYPAPTGRDLPIHPAYRPDPAIVAAIRAQIDRVRLAKLNAAVKAARGHA